MNHEGGTDGHWKRRFGGKITRELCPDWPKCGSQKRSKHASKTLGPLKKKTLESRLENTRKTVEKPSKPKKKGKKARTIVSKPEMSGIGVEGSSVVENVRFYGLKLQIAFSETLYDSIRTDLRLIEALQSLQIESRHLLDH